MACCSCWQTCCTPEKIVHNFFGAPYRYDHDKVNDMESLNRGDHVAFPRPCGNCRVYWHHAIVEKVNQGKVTLIHYFTNKRDTSQQLPQGVDMNFTIEEESSVGCSCKDKVRNFCSCKAGCKVKVRKDTLEFSEEPDCYKLYHNEKTVRNPENVVEEATKHLDEAHYHLLDRNCEHFANQCKEDSDPGSTQVHQCFLLGVQVFLHAIRIIIMLSTDLYFDIMDKVWIGAAISGVLEICFCCFNIYQTLCLTFSSRKCDTILVRITVFVCAIGFMLGGTFLEIHLERKEGKKMRPFTSLGIGLGYILGSIFSNCFLENCRENECFEDI